MVLQLAQHVQSFLHKYNRPRLSFYDQMMTNKLKEKQIREQEEEILTAKRKAEAMSREEDVVRKIDLFMFIYFRFGFLLDWVPCQAKWYKLCMLHGIYMSQGTLRCKRRCISFVHFLSATNVSTLGPQAI